jgi:signal transduction histidine kinase
MIKMKIPLSNPDPPMDPAELFQVYQMLQKYVGWSAADEARISHILLLVRDDFPRLIEDFYDAIQGNPQTASVITGGPEQIERLKQTLLFWIENLFSGRYDADFVQRRWQVGLRHVQIGLDQVFTNAALSRLRNGLLSTLGAAYSQQPNPGDVQEMLQMITTLNRLLDLDLAVIECAYQSQYSKRVRRNERYATIGKVSGGIAHELRNPLNVVKTSVYYLLNAKSPSPEKKQTHLERIERQVTRCDEIITTLTDFARLPDPVIELFDLRSLLKECVQENVHRRDIEVHLAIDEAVENMLGERKQLRIAFGNLIRNACEAMEQGGQLTINCAPKQEAVYISFTDEGCGIPPERIPEITEPLFTTKARGIGLGLAVTKMILDQHKAALMIFSDVGKGSTFSVRFPKGTN